MGSSWAARRPGPGVVLGVIALTFALSGAAVAGTNALSKKQVKKIAKQQAIKQIDKRASSLSVKKADEATNAQNAINAQNASQLGGIPAAQHVRDVEIVTGNGPGFDSSDKDFSVPCPPGKKVIGGGAQINANPPEVIVITGSQPALNGLTWHATAAEISAYPGNWELQVNVVCARVD